MTVQIWKVEWNDDMSVGILDIDEDHKGFITLINKLNRTIIQRQDQAEVRQVLQLILLESEKHFAREEHYFETWHYPDVDDHIKKHQQILKTLSEIMAGCISYGFDSEWIATSLKVKQILIDHMLQEDRKYSEFYLGVVTK